MSGTDVHHGWRALAGVGLLALFAGCNKAGVTNAAPRLTTNISTQTASGGQVFSLDLANFVSDRETAAANLTYTVVSGGGSFAGSTYSRTFDTLGAYTVTVKVADPFGKSLQISFDVDVPTANLAVATAGNDLMLLDTDTGMARPVADGDGFTVTYKATLTKGFVVYERQAGSNDDLFLYDATTTATTVLGERPDVAERFAAMLGSHRILFTAALATKTTMHLFDVRGGGVVTIVDLDGEQARNPMVTTDSMVYLEVTSLGQGDIYKYDPASDSLTGVSTDSNGEVLQATITGGAAVFTRIGGGGETDLYYHKTGVGVVEVGASLPAIAALNKTYKAANSAGLIVFEVLSGAQTDLYAWNPANGVTTALGTSGDNETFAALTSQGHVIFNVNVGGTDNNLLWFDKDNLAVRAFPASAVNDTWLGNLGDGRVVFSKAEATGVHLFLASYNGTVVSETTIVATAAANFSLAKVLANDKIVYNDLTVGGIRLFDPTGPNLTPFGATTAFAGELATSGDFVFTTDNGGQTELSLWDESATSMVDIAVGQTSEAFAGGLANGRVLFTRVVFGSTARNLFVWTPTPTPAEQQITDDGLDHSILTTFSADNR